MPEGLGKIEKPILDDFKSGRKLFFVPLIFSSRDSPADFLEIFNKYWTQVDSQLGNLEAKLGQVKKIYHEMIPKRGPEGLNLLKELNSSSYNIVQTRVEKGCQLEAVEDDDIMTELMDWSRCLSLGLQSQKVVSKIYEFYNESNKKRNEFIARRLDETLKADETGILFLGEGHRVQFPSSIRIIYVSPPALDEVQRWIRNYQAKSREPGAEGQKTQGTDKEPSE
jgi:hypothetical protein